MSTTTLQSVAHAAERHEYFFGETKMTSGSGAQVGTMLSLVKLSFHPDDNKIVERTIQIRDKNPAKEQTITFTVKGNEFQFSDANKTFNGNGSFSGGEPWQWKGWRYSMTLGNKDVVKGEETLGAAGLSSSKTISDSDGRPRLRLSEELARISEQSYEILRAKFVAP